jgi:predicted alpha/beta-hydrolase family hydrolase
MTTRRMSGPGRLLSLILCLTSMACSATAGPATPPGPDRSPGHPFATPRPAASALSLPDAPAKPTPTPRPYEAITLTTDDGRTLNARLWGVGKAGVVLAHGFSEYVGQDGWDSFAEYLASLDYGVLTFTFRGFCDREACSERPMGLGDNWRDVVAAVERLRAAGSQSITVIGASMGGLAVLRAAQLPDLELAGVVSLATPRWPSKYYSGEPEENDLTDARLERIAIPKLFIAGSTDVQTPEMGLRSGVDIVSFAADAEAMFDASPWPKEIAIVDSNHHSSELVTNAGAETVTETRRIILAFLVRWTNVTRPTSVTRSKGETLI